MGQQGCANSDVDLDRVVAFGKTMGHKLRIRILLRVDRDGQSSPTMLARELPDDTLSNISYHVRVMGGLGVLEEVERRAVRGATAEHLYALSEVGREVLQVIRQIGARSS